MHGSIVRHGKATAIVVIIIRTVALIYVNISLIAADRGIVFRTKGRRETNDGVYVRETSRGVSWSSRIHAKKPKREFPAVRTSVINVGKYLPSATVRSTSDSVSSSKKDLVYSLKKDKQEV